MDGIRLAVVGLSLSAIAAAQGTISLAPPSAVPSGASSVLSPSFAGFGIEPSNLFSFTGGETPNTLSINLLQNLADYTGTPPHLRIGGNTEDNIVYQEDYNDWAREVNPNSVAPNGAFKPDEYIIGPRFFQAIDRFPTGTPITYGLNMAYEQSDYLDLIVKTAGAARSQLTNVNLVSFEVGNEPDLYTQNAFRSAPWNGQIYTQQWLERVSAIWTNVLEGNTSSQFFEPACTASTVASVGVPFEISSLVSDGITVDANGSSKSYVAGFNQHDYYYYIGVSTYTLDFQVFTNFNTLTNQLSAWTTQLQQATSAGYPYFLREMGIVGPIGYAGITDTFAASLWQLNFFLYAATVGIASVNMHMTDNSNSSAWQPIPYPPYSPEPFVRPLYYAWPAMTQVIGAGCSTQIASLPVTGVPSSYTGRIVAYTSYQQGSLAAIILINSAIANVSNSDKQSLSIDLSLPDYAGQTLYLSYLTNNGADAKSGTTWNGTSYEQSGDGTATKVDNTVNTVKIGSDGSATVTLRDSQAVVANIGSFVGSKERNSTACAALASSTPDAASGAPSSSSGSSSTKSSSASKTAVMSISNAITSSLTSVIGPTATSASGSASMAMILNFMLPAIIGIFVLNY